MTIGWPEDEAIYRSEQHFGDRMLRCLSERPGNLWDLIERTAEATPLSEALVCDEFRCSWRELLSLAEAFATGLAGRGIGSGDRVVLLLGNRPEFVIALFALAKIGAIAVPVGVREKAPGLLYVAEQSGAKAILHEANLAHIVPPLSFSLALGTLPTRQMVAEFACEEIALSEDGPDEDAPALIMYTSGTTGRPKGAIVAHLALIHIGAAYARCMALGSNDRSVCVVPLSHITGITATICPMAWSGGAMIIVPEFDARQFVALASSERMTHTVMVPAMYNLLLARTNLAEANLGDWRIGGFGGAPMPTPTIKRIAEQLPGLSLMNCYGATETCGAATIMPSDRLADKSDCVGWAVPGVDIRVVSEEGKAVAADEIGELWIGGVTVTPGYWENREATSENFTEGLWHSGDLGSIDKEGFVRVHDRIKDMINRGGYKIYTAEVEGILMAHPDILEAAIIAKPCPVLGERVHAFVTLRDDCEALDAEGLAKYCAPLMTDYKVPQSFTISHQPLPRNLNGKIVKTELRNRLQQLESSG